MELIQSTDQEYAHFEEGTDEINQSLVDDSSLTLEGIESLKGLRIEVSQFDRVPETIRKKLDQGKYFIVE